MGFEMCAPQHAELQIITWFATPLQVPEPVDEGDEEEEGEDELPPQPPLCRWVTQDAFENLSDWQWPTVLREGNATNELGMRLR